MANKRKLKLVEQRKLHVQREVRNRKGEKTETIVNDLAGELFLTPRTIWNDLRY